MDDVLFVPGHFKEQRVSVTLNNPIAFAQGPNGHHVPVTSGFYGTVKSIQPSCIVVATEVDSLLGPAGEYAISKKCLLAVGLISQIERALVVPRN